ncbi:hypothetical protein GW17_00028351 [Ensete ventricosum]|nr:hypothetical protein GW17_00028351 [Ensete ventricosum]
MRKWDSWPLSDLVLCETHLNDAGGVRLGIVRVLLVLLPPQEVGRVLSMGVARGLPGEQLLRHYGLLRRVGMGECLFAVEGLFGMEDMSAII